MTIHILFLTITITKRKKSLEQALHEQYTETLYEHHKDQLFSNHYIR
ncbi:YrzI family small protein [Neobacillus sp. LXY-1]